MVITSSSSIWNERSISGIFFYQAHQLGSLVVRLEPFHGVDEWLLVSLVRPVPGDCVLKALGNGHVPDHHPKVVVGNDSVDQFGHGGLTGLTLGPQQNGVGGCPAFHQVWTLTQFFCLPPEGQEVVNLLDVLLVGIISFFFHWPCLQTSYKVLLDYWGDFLKKTWIVS